MTLKSADLETFDRDLRRIPKFWSRLGGEPPFEGLKVLDIGCGHGSLCVDVATKGAKTVIGLDIKERLIFFARENVLQNYPKLKNILDFQCCDIANLREGKFDIMLAQASFEHIQNLDNVFAELKKRLKVGGKMYIGFGPLYNSPYGDHKLTKAFLPWGHLIFPESVLIKRLNKNLHKELASISEEFNKLSLAEFRTLFYTSGLHVSYFRVNASNNSLAKVFNLIRRIPFLEEYFSYNLYCILEKPC